MTKRKRKELERQKQIKMHSHSKMCGKKKKYATEIEADAYAKMFSDPRYNHGKEKSMRSYWCPLCYHYHLTSKKYRKKELTKIDNML